jgi:hemoglobin
MSLPEMNMRIRNFLRLVPLAAACVVFHAVPASAQDAAPDAAPAQQRAPGVPDPAPAHPELAGVFEQFGGMPGMTALMDDFMVVLLEDPRMRPFFEKVDHDRVKRQLAEQFCAILGGGCAYSGRDMKETHAAFAIDKADFNALVEDLQIAMDRRGVPFRAQNKLLAILAPMHREVITR